MVEPKVKNVIRIYANLFRRRRDCP